MGSRSTSPRARGDPNPATPPHVFPDEVEELTQGPPPLLTWSHLCSPKSRISGHWWRPQPPASDRRAVPRAERRRAEQQGRHDPESPWVAGGAADQPEADRPDPHSGIVGRFQIALTWANRSFGARSNMTASEAFWAPPSPSPKSAIPARTATGLPVATMPSIPTAAAASTASAGGPSPGRRGVPPPSAPRLCRPPARRADRGDAAGILRHGQGKVGDQDPDRQGRQPEDTWDGGRQDRPARP